MSQQTKAFLTVISVLLTSAFIGGLANNSPIELSCENPKEIDIKFILLRNTSVFSLILVGYLTYGVLSISLLAFNGFILGYLLNSRPYILALKLVIPHGVFELTGFILISYISLLSSFRLRRSHDPLVVLCYKKYIILSYILLVIGALVEWKITPYIACGVM